MWDDHDEKVPIESHYRQERHQVKSKSFSPSQCPLNSDKRISDMALFSLAIPLSTLIVRNEIILFSIALCVCVCAQERLKHRNKLWIELNKWKKVCWCIHYCGCDCCTWFLALRQNVAYMHISKLLTCVPVFNQCFQFYQTNSIRSQILTIIWTHEVMG